MGSSSEFCSYRKKGTPSPLSLPFSTLWDMDVMIGVVILGHKMEAMQ